MIVYRPMVHDDFHAGLALCRAAGWNQTSEDWNLFLALSACGTFVAVNDEGVVKGAVATVRYDNRFGWIGMVLVDPENRRRGIGIGLMREALHHLRDQDTVKLDATPAGRQVYVQLDFKDEYPINRMELPGSAARPVVSNARPIHPDDLPGIFVFDREVFGAGRETVLKAMLIRNQRSAWLFEDENGIRSYCFGRLGHAFAHIGPVIATDMEAAKEVASAALNSMSGKPVVMDTLCHSPQWLDWLTSLGFEEQRSLIRMYRGTNAFPGIPARQYAILGPEFG